MSERKKPGPKPQGKLSRNQLWSVKVDTDQKALVKEAGKVFGIGAALGIMFEALKTALDEVSGDKH